MQHLGDFGDQLYVLRSNQGAWFQITTIALCYLHATLVAFFGISLHIPPLSSTTFLLINIDYIELAYDEDANQLT